MSQPPYSEVGDYAQAMWQALEAGYPENSIEAVEEANRIYAEWCRAAAEQD